MKAAIFNHTITFEIKAQWDEVANVYVVTCDGVPGLVTEAETLREVSEKLEIMIPELLGLNSQELRKL